MQSGTAPSSPGLRPLILSALLLLAACDPPYGPGIDHMFNCNDLDLDPHDPLVQTGDVTGVLSPAVVQHGDTYYLFSTGPGIPIRQSTDLIHWEVTGQVLDSLPDWTRTLVPEGDTLSSPDVAYFNGRYHLYYALSSSGSQVSAIGLATNVTLDSMDPAYEWMDRGAVIDPGTGVADSVAMDPGVVLDAEGRLWLTWSASAGKGIKLHRLDSGTGLLSRQDGTVYSLLSFSSSRMRSPGIIHRNGWYYLFITTRFGSIIARRASDVTGPYPGESYKSVLYDYGRIQDPGHSFMLADDDRYFMVHHFLDDENDDMPTLQVRSLVWDAGGWPLAGEPYDGTFPVVDGSPAPDVTGTWAYKQPVVTREIRLMANGEVGEISRSDAYDFCLAEGTWRQDGSIVVLDWKVHYNRIDSLVVPTHGSWFVGRYTYPDGIGGPVRGARLTRSDADG